MLLTAEILPFTKYVSENTLLQRLLWFRSKCTSGLDGCKMYCSKKERNKKSHNCKKKNVFKNKASLLKAFGRFWSSVFCTWGFQKNIFYFFSCHMRSLKF